MSERQLENAVKELLRSEYPSMTDGKGDRDNVSVNHMLVLLLAAYKLGRREVLEKVMDVVLENQNKEDEDDKEKED